MLLLNDLVSVTNSPIELIGRRGLKTPQAVFLVVLHILNE